MASPKIETYQGTRLTFQSPKFFDEVMQKLYFSIGGPDRIGSWKRPVHSVTISTEEARERFEEGIKAVLGPHEFMIFKRGEWFGRVGLGMRADDRQEFDHGSWIPFYGVGDGLKSKRIILGNPMIAITMLKHDITAGLAVPVEVLVSEVLVGGEKKTEVMYNLPSGLIAGINKDENLVEAVGKLDEKLERLVRWVCQ
ncbi:uncharacterized protein PAC_17670 [Phialocephala subalpina]|uniref:DUF302 domain-containing protein n=1 Tax=Phialocephala subalpina TaxID=576137 RepID=A0A1L7XRS3_9HELO|nr:uncharacterized protein PAC_17670 [Phialocephala subalpina]